MILIELEKPVVEPVSVGQAKAWARIERGDEDAIVAGLISAARECVEQRTGLVLGPRLFRLSLDDCPADGRVAIARRPVGRVTSVRSFDGDGREILHDPGSVRIVGETFVFDPRLRMGGGIEIEFQAGDAGVPEGIVQAILRIVAASYETRGIVGTALQPAIVPAFADALLAPFRRVTL